MLFVGEEEEVFSKQRLDDEFWIVDRQVDDGGIELAAQNVRNERRRRALLNDGPDAGMILSEAAEHLG